MVNDPRSLSVDEYCKGSSISRNPSPTSDKISACNLQYYVKI